MEQPGWLSDCVPGRRGGDGPLRQHGQQGLLRHGGRICSNKILLSLPFFAMFTYHYFNPAMHTFFTVLVSFYPCPYWAIRKKSIDSCLNDISIIYTLEIFFLKPKIRILCHSYYGIPLLSSRSRIYYLLLVAIIKQEL